MTTTNKDFKVKNGLKVNGTATINNQLVLGNTALQFNSNTGRLEINVNNQWSPIAFLEDAETLSFEDIGLAIDYDGNPVYIIQGNGVVISGSTKFVDGGNPLTTQVRYIFDSGEII